MDESRLELKVGALTAVALVLAVGLVLALARLSGGSQFTFHADFAYAGGLPSGAVVKIAGVKVGRVKNVEFRPTARDADGTLIPVRLTIEVDREAAVALRADAVATVGTLGALGETYLEVIPGRSSAPLKERDAVRGLDPPRLDVLLSRLFSVLEGATNDEAFRSFLVEVAELAGTINSVLTENRDDMKNLFRNLAAVLDDGRLAVKDIRVAAKSASALLANPELGATVHDLSVASKAAREQLPPLLADARALVASLEKAAGALTPEDIAKVKSTLARVDALAANLQKVSVNAETLIAGIQKGEGTAGKLVKDPMVYDDLRALLADLKAHPWKLVWKD